MKIIFLVSFILLFTETWSQQCFNVTDCNWRGLCLQGECICENGWISERDNKIGCTYKQANLSYFLYLELFFVYGSGHFYAGRYAFGAVKMSCFLFVLLLMPLSSWISKLIASKCDSVCLRVASSVLITLYLLFFLAWIIFDFIAIKREFYSDGKDYPFYSE